MIPSGPLRWEFSIPGCRTVELARKFKPDQEIEVVLDSEARLRELGIPTGMVRVAAGKARYMDKVTIEDDFFTDKFEVSNEEYRQFVESGGYQTAAYWKDQVFQKDGETMSWQDAVKRFVDRTGQPGPATWENGTYPKG